MRRLSISEAIDAVLAGEVIVYPTETFFGIGGLALSEEAVLKVYEAKKRKSSEPLPVILGHEEQLSLLVDQVPRELATLLQTLWPGPLTVIFKARCNAPASLTAGTGKVAVRLTSHPIARELSLHCGPLTSSSANLAGEPPPAEAGGVSRQLLDFCAGLLDMPPNPKGGQPSTLIELIASDRLKLVRHGAVNVDVFRQMGWDVQ